MRSIFCRHQRGPWSRGFEAHAMSALEILRIALAKGCFVWIDGDDAVQMSGFLALPLRTMVLERWQDISAIVREHSEPLRARPSTASG